MLGSIISFFSQNCYNTTNSIYFKKALNYLKATENFDIRFSKNTRLDLNSLRICFITVLKELQSKQLNDRIAGGC